jgi:tRNA-dihydrouridine synthase
LREALTIPFTVKTRLGFDTAARFDELLPVFARHGLDLLTVHGRTEAEMYRTEVRYHWIARAVALLPCPVLANGNVHSAAKAAAVLCLTGARGLMIGRGAIRNPWIFRQIREHLGGQAPFVPTGRDVLRYVGDLHATVRPPGLHERAYVAKLKKYMNYLGLGIDPAGAFLHRIRRVTTEAEFFGTCEAYLDHDQPMVLEPFSVPLGERDVMAGEHG